MYDRTPLPLFLGKKEISVLELLELQARARAIRSQLALEPVTKIELDSENDSDGSSSSKPVKSSTTNTSDNSKEQANQSTSKNVVQESNGMQIIKPTVPAVKPVRLKRNFRQRQNEDYDPDDDDETKSVENAEPKEKDVKVDDAKDETIVETEKSDEKERSAPERSPSPDLIPIIQEPETYCISSDSDEPGSSSVPKYITYPTVVREKLPETEDELFLKKIKEGSSVDLRDLIKARRVDKQTDGSGGNSETVDTSNDAVRNSTQSNEKSPPSANEVSQEDKDTEPEEGELTDGDEQEESVENQVTILSSDDENEVSSKKSDRDAVSPQDAVSEKVDEETSSESSSSENDSDTDSSDAPIFKEPDDDDDIIDLGKDEELDFEVDVDETKTKKSRKTKKKLKNADKLTETVPDSVEEVKSIEQPVDAEVVSEVAEIPQSTDVASKDEVEEEPSTAEDAAEVNISLHYKSLQNLKLH